MRIAASRKLLELVSIDQVDQNPRNYINLVNIVMVWRLATLRPEDREAMKRDGLDYR